MQKIKKRSTRMFEIFDDFLIQGGGKEKKRLSSLYVPKTL